MRSNHSTPVLPPPLFTRAASYQAVVECPNLASRVLGLSLPWLSDDMLATPGCPVWLAEALVRKERCEGILLAAAE